MKVSQTARDASLPFGGNPRGTRLRGAGRRAAQAWLPLALLAASLAAMGMGGGSGSTEKVIPIPERNFSVNVTDSRGNKVLANRFTWEGKVHFEGQFGTATVTVPFAKVQAIEIKPSATTASPTTIVAHLTLKAGDGLDLAIERGSKCYGETDFGTYEIFLRDIARIQFQ